MKKLRYPVLLNTLMMLFFFNSCTRPETLAPSDQKAGKILIGWASADVTPDKPVDLRGQFPARISEGVMDPITVTALAIESPKESAIEKVVLISCDIVAVDTAMLNAVRNILKNTMPEIEPENIIINATHTHTAPLISEDESLEDWYGIRLDAMPPSDYLKFIAGRIAETVEEAWKNRKPGGISYGMGQAVVGHNRLTVDKNGKSVMYKNPNFPDFSHIEGFEDHSVNLVYTWDKNSKLTGIIVNVGCPAQISEHSYLISADYWHDTRVEVRRRLGNNIFILPQCSAAGDQSPHILVGLKAEERMQRIMGPDSIKTGRGSQGHRMQVALRIADAMSSLYPLMKKHIEWDPVFCHRTGNMELSRRLISMENVNSALKESDEWKRKFDEALHQINENPGIRDNPRWYSDITRYYRLMKRGQNVRERYELEKVQPRIAVEVHMVRLGDLVMATNPFELYLDYGIRIKARSPAVQTFIVQLCNGYYGYLPPYRSVAGGSYGAEPASTEIGPEGGQELVDGTLEMIVGLWKD